MAGMFLKLKTQRSAERSALKRFRSRNRKFFFFIFFLLQMQLCLPDALAGGTVSCGTPAFMKRKESLCDGSFAAGLPKACIEFSNLMSESLAYFEKEMKGFCQKLQNAGSNACKKNNGQACSQIDTSKLSENAMKDLEVIQAKLAEFRKNIDKVKLELR